MTNYEIIMIVIGLAGLLIAYTKLIVEILKKK